MGSGILFNSESASIGSGWRVPNEGRQQGEVTVSTLQCFSPPHPTSRRTKLLAKVSQQQCRLWNHQDSRESREAGGEGWDLE